MSVDIMFEDLAKGPDFAIRSPARMRIDFGHDWRISNQLSEAAGLPREACNDFRPRVSQT